MSAVKDMIEKGKATAKAGYEQGNGLMDKVPALKSKRNKLIVWGVLAALAAVTVFGLIGGGNSEERAAAKLSDACREWLCDRYGEDAIKEYEFESLVWNENRAILKAKVSIDAPPSITNPANEGYRAAGTAVMFLEADGDDINVVEFEMQ